MAISGRARRQARSGAYLRKAGAQSIWLHACENKFAPVTIESVGEVVMLPLTVQPPVSGWLVKLTTPPLRVVFKVLGPQLPIGDVKVTL